MDLIPIDLSKNDAEYSRQLGEHLERGNILLLNPTPFVPTPENCQFLRDQKQVDSGSHKNIAYKPHLQRVTGADVSDTRNVDQMRDVLANYSEGAISYLSRILPDYARKPKSKRSILSNWRNWSTRWFPAPTPKPCAS